MKLPSFISNKLKQVVVKDDRELFEKLSLSTDDFIQFFTAAAGDEVWSSSHPLFFTLSLGWLTRQYLQNKISSNHVEQIVSVCQDNYRNLRDMIPRTFEIKLAKDTVFVNPMIIGWMSPYFKSHLKNNFISLEKESDIVLNAIAYMETKDTGDVWKLTKEEAEVLLDIAEDWELLKLANECEEVLKRYITQENAEKTAISSYVRGRKILFARSIDLLNQNIFKGRIILENSKIVFEFEDFTESSLQGLKQVRKIVTHLSFSGELPSDPNFLQTINECPKLIGLILKGSDAASPFFEELPKSIYDFDFSECLWLSDSQLRDLIDYLPQITVLNLSQNTQLTYKGFGELKRLYGLKTLSLEGCHVIDDDILSLILQGTHGLLELNLSGCRKLADFDFKKVPYLQVLGLSRTKITDDALTVICIDCKALEVLELDNCPNLSFGGILGALKNAKSLKKISLEDNGFDLSELRVVLLKVQVLGA